MSNFAIPGVVVTGTTPKEPPLLLVISREKCGKSTLATTLFNWPNQGDEPLVLAADATGPDSCSKFGCQVQHIKIKDCPPLGFAAKFTYCTNLVEKYVQSGASKPGSIMIDCMSTLAERIMSDDARFSKNPDPRSHYSAALDCIRNNLNRLIDLGIPVIMLSWLKEGGTFENTLASGQKVKRTVLGGPAILGQALRALVAGKAHMILMLDKVKIGHGEPGADQDGYVRQFHTRTYDSIEAGGRYTLPEPSPAHLGWCLDVIMGRRQL